MKLFLSKIISTFFFIGKFPIAPGTIGSLVATLLVAVIFYQPYGFSIDSEGVSFGIGGGYINQNYIIYLLNFLAVFFYIIGVYASELYSKSLKKDDPSEIVIDEVAGIFTAYSLVSLGFALLYNFNKSQFLIYFSLAGWFLPIIFILFRIFDILKPWHVGWADKNLKGGVGIMMDDVIAGIYTAITFFLIFFALIITGVMENFLSVD